MSSVKPDDLLRYVEGEIQDADELNRIEAALETDPALAAEFEQLNASFEPAPDVIEDIRAMFQALDASVWARLQYSAAPGSSDSPATASLELPDGQRASVTMRTTVNGMSLDMAPQPRGWRAASIALFHPRVAGGGPLEISSGAEADDLPESVARREAAATWDVRERESAFSLSADHRDDGWISEPATNALGGRAWLEDSADGLALVVDLPESAGPIEAVRYRLDCRGTDASKPAGRVPLTPDQGRRTGQLPLGVATRHVRNSPQWRLRVEPVGDEDRLHLDASQFRSVVGDDFQTLILTAAVEPSEPQRTALSATFQNERQRAMWNDRGITRWVRFERA